MAKGSSLNRREAIKKKPWNIWKEEIAGMVKMWVKSTDIPSPLKFSKLCLTVEKIITLSDLVLKVCRGNMLRNYIINEKENRELKRGRVSILHSNW